MEKLKQADLTWCIRRLGKDLATFMKEKGNNAFIAGGFIRSCISNEKVNDVDIFVSDPDLAEAYANKMANGTYIHETEFARTVKNQKFPVQFIHKWTYDKPTDVIPDFDFTIARAVIWYDTEQEQWESAIDPDFYSDLASKRLSYCAPDRDELAGGSMLRVLKFYQRGFRIPMESLARVMSRMVAELEPHLDTTDEIEVSKVLSGMLREVDPAVDPEHLTH